MRLGGREIGPGLPAFVIAEGGVNHNGDPELARRLVEAAAQAGADAIKFQTFRADRLCTASAPKAEYQQRTTGNDDSQLDMLRALELSEAAHRDLKAQAEALGLVFLSTPFDPASADLLQDLGVDAFKVGSGDLTDLPLLQHVARMRRPILLSTGMSQLGEVDAAVRTIREAGGEDLVLLHCVSCYPAPPDAANLRAMDTLRQAFQVPVGWSDHTLGVEVALAAAARGASVVEKHLTLDPSLPGPDHAASLDPSAFGGLVRGVRLVESALGDGAKRPAPCENNTRTVARKSLAASRDLPAGELLSREALTSLRPGTGIAPAELQNVLGRRINRAIRRGELLTWDHL